MKRILVLLLIIAVVVLGWLQLRRSKLSLGFLQAQTASVGRGDLTIPINGTGEIKPRSTSEIKPEASGEVIAIPVEAGQLVSAGEIITRLDPEDEERNVMRARNNLERSQAVLEQQKLRLKDRETVALMQLDARIDGVKAQLVDAEYNLNKVERGRQAEEEYYSDQEYIRVKSQYDQLAAQLKAAEADREQADINIQLARREVELAEKAVETAQTDLRDAEERLKETEIRAPIDGMISNLSVKMGEVVQGGRTTITGGTVLARVADITEIYVHTEVSDADIGQVLWLAPAEARPGGADLARELETAMVSTSGAAAILEAAGTPVQILVDAFRDELFEGVIERIYPEPRKISNIVTYLVDIRVTSPNRRKLALVLGMQADVEFTAQSVTDVILVPHDAIRRGPNDELGVYVPERTQGSAEPRARFVPCRFGLDNGNFAELLEGEEIGTGTVVYTKLPTRLDDEDEE